MNTEAIFENEITVTVSWEDAELTSMNGLPFPVDDADPRLRAGTTVNLIVACRALCAAVIDRTGDLSALTAFGDAHHDEDGGMQ